jgi:DNA polymerase III delta subunit
MIVFLCGPDDFRRREKRKFVENEFKRKYPSGSTAVFRGEEGSFIKLQDFLRQESLFEAKKLGLVEDLELYSELPKLWKEIAKNKNTTLIVESRKIPPKSSPLAKIEVSREEFPFLSGKEWRNFATKLAKDAGTRLSPEALMLLTQVFEGDSWGLATEIQKLASLGKEVSIKELASLELEMAPEYWPLLNGLKSWNAKERLKSLALLQAENEPAAKTFNILAASAAQKTPQFAEYDEKVKRGSLEYEEVLLDAVLIP